MVWNRVAKVVGIFIVILTATSCTDSSDRDYKIVLCIDRILQDPDAPAQCKNESGEICTRIHTPMPLSARIRESVDNITQIACSIGQLIGIGCFFERTYKDCVVSGVQICKDIKKYFPCNYKKCVKGTLSRCELEYK